MKDYYYILGISESASPDEIKKAYKKLSTKFHPDKNDGDEFFSNRFKEILEAYENLIDPIKRNIYDNEVSIQNRSRTGLNFVPEIEFFKANKEEIDFDEEVTFSWKTINADKVTIKPFGQCAVMGEKTYRIKDFKKAELIFELVAENSRIEKQKFASLIIRNKTYTELYEYFTNEINVNAKNNFNKDDKEYKRVKIKYHFFERFVIYWIIISLLISSIAILVQFFSRIINEL